MTSSQSSTPKWVCYLAAWITGLIFLAVEKNDEDVRWHAAQSTAFFGAVTIITIVLSIFTFIPILGILLAIINWLIGVAAFIMWILFMVKASQVERIIIPYVTEFAERNLLNLFK